VEFDFDKPKKASSARVYWFDDQPTGGGCRIPASWKLLYKQGDAWREVKTSDVYALKKDTYNAIRFGPVESQQFRIEVQLQPGFSGGILQWDIL